MKYVSPLTEDEMTKLDDIVKNGCSSRVRHRAHCVLLSAKGYRTDEIADIFGADRRTVSPRIGDWEKSGFAGLPDSPRIGRPGKLTEEEKGTAVDLLRRNPRSVKTVIAELAEITGKTVSTKTLKRLAKSAGPLWERIKKSVRQKTDKEAEELKEQKKREIGELKKPQEKGEADLYYFDAAGSDLQPGVPYAWQPKGVTVELPSSRSSRLNVLGFLSTADSDFCPFVFECSVYSEVTAACFDRFCERISEEKPTYVIVGNAPVHTGRKFADSRERWAEKGLFIIYLPPYSPEMNLIEILWRLIRYLWLPFSAYLSFENLAEELEKILKGVGSEYVISFS